MWRFVDPTPEEFVVEADRKRRNRPGCIVRRLRRGLAGAVVLLAAAVVVPLWVIPPLLSLPLELEAPPVISTTVTDRAGVPLRRFLVNGEEVVADYAALPDIPQALINATVAAEDKRFWTHGGVDFAALVRAANQAAEVGQPISGASTISQQLIKITMPVPRPRNLRTKIEEILLARKLEMSRDKGWILENYLNRIPYGNLYTGCRAAAEGYFAKPLADLTVAECALLAGLPNKPTRFNPYRNLAGARERQRWILDRMTDDGYLTSEERDRAKAQPILLRKERSAFRAPHAVELLRATAPQTLVPGTVRTTLDHGLQTFAEQALDEHLTFVASVRNVSPYLHAAVVVIENATGDVLVLTGSRDFADRRSGQINGAWTPRSPGSALKPFTYLLALQQGIPATTVLADVPVEFPTPLGVYRPVNYDHTWMGPVDLRRALANSLNVPAVRLLEQLGGPSVLQDSLRRAGLSTLTEAPSHYGLGLTLGSAPVRLLELTNAYACLARLGEFRPWRLLADAPLPPPVRIFDADACSVLADMLSDNAARARNFGWDTPLRGDRFRFAVKTGTSSDFRDGWTLGFTPEFTVGVWVGNFDHTPLDRFSGTAGAGPIFRAVLDRLHRDRPATWPASSDDVVTVTVDALTGHAVPASGLPVPARPESRLVLRRTLPRPASPADYDADGRVLLPPVYASWHRTAPAPLQARTIVRSGGLDREFAIRSPVDGLVVFLDPDLPDGGTRLSLSADAEDPEVEWTSPTLVIDPGPAVARLVPGTHEIQARHAPSGQVCTVRIVVRDT